MHKFTSACAASTGSGEPAVRVLAVPEGVAGRLDKVLARLVPEHSRSRLQAWIDNGHVRVNGEPATSVRQFVAYGDELQVTEQTPPEQLAYAAEAVAFKVVAESASWIVVDKPAGLVVHPGAGNWQGTLLNGLLHRYPEVASVARAGIVHRLDKDTSGLLVVARTEIAQTSLVRQLQERTMGREYTALVHGRLERSGTVDRAMGRDARVPVRMSVERPIAPKPAVTHFAAVRQGMLDARPVTQVTCTLETGRTHQIRVHMTSLGHPLLGDATYGGKLVQPVTRQMLHARALRFVDPDSGIERAFEADLPADMLQVMEAIHWR